MWGRGTIALTLLCGVYFTVCTGFLPFLRLPTIFKKTIGSLFDKPKQKDGVSPFAAVSTALGGTMGVGKTTVCQQLKRQLKNSVFLDGDWCWDANPFCVTEETKSMVVDNICYLLNNFIHCSAYENIIFCWVMHRQDIINRLLEKLDLKQCEVKVISLICDSKTLKNRLQKDIDSGIRTADIIDRSMERIPLYQGLNTIKIDTTSKSIDRVANEIIAR